MASMLLLVSLKLETPILRNGQAMQAEASIAMLGTSVFLLAHIPWPQQVMGSRQESHISRGNYGNIHVLCYACSLPGSPGVVTAFRSETVSCLQVSWPQWPIMESTRGYLWLKFYLRCRTTTTPPFPGEQLAIIQMNIHTNAGRALRINISVKSSLINRGSQSPNT